MGKSVHVHNVSYAGILAALIMWFLLIGNALYNFWDYREGE